MSAKEVGLIVIIALITIGGFFFLAPEYKKRAELKVECEQKRIMIEKLHSNIENNCKIISKLDQGDPTTISRILRGRFGVCSPEENIFKFQSNTSKLHNAN